MAQPHIFLIRNGGWFVVRSYSLLLLIQARAQTRIPFKGQYGYQNQMQVVKIMLTIDSNKGTPMKPFLILLLPFALFGCGAEPDAPTDDTLSAELAEPVPVVNYVPTPAQTKAVAAIKRLGGKVRFGISGDVVMVELNHTQITDAELEHLKGMTSLTELKLAGTQVTDAGLET